MGLKYPSTGNVDIHLQPHILFPKAELQTVCPGDNTEQDGGERPFHGERQDDGPRHPRLAAVSTPKPQTPNLEPRILVPATLGL